MAGDWTAIRLDLYTDPRVLRIAEMTTLDPNHVVGNLGRVWLWAGAHTTNGFIEHASCATIDSQVGQKDFGKAMAAVDWAKEEEGGLRFPRWSKFNASAAKARLKAAKRSANFRNAQALRASRKDNTKLVPTEQNRTEEKRKEKKAAPPLVFPPGLDRPEFASKWGEWKSYRQERRLPKYTPRSEAAQLKRCAGWGIGAATEAINTAIANAWQGLFEPKSRPLTGNGSAFGTRTVAMGVHE